MKNFFKNWFCGSNSENEIIPESTNDVKKDIEVDTPEEVYNYPIIDDTTEWFPLGEDGKTTQIKIDGHDMLFNISNSWWVNKKESITIETKCVGTKKNWRAYIITPDTPKEHRPVTKYIDGQTMISVESIKKYLRYCLSNYQFTPVQISRKEELKRQQGIVYSDDII